ncbi:Vacuolar protein sorting-associated protein 13C [Microtus ochrogaster]|uniref:Vacuolar protein sorting-associated protein 13C n=1 Tax=Microtus ochrogaster TaxID=79684 RepID=A0A8J6GLS3_MICOH|nr:Vacuolar protein sorting-associated protein 13C [Microtus ochrogaster]
MVLESVVADLLNRFLGDYVENLNKSQLKLGIWGGNVALDNLQIKENALSELDVPFKVKAGQIDKLTLKIPWKNLYGEAVVATLEGLYLLVVPGASIKYDAEKEEKSLQDIKQKELSRIEEALQKAAEKDKPKEAKKDTFLEKLATQVIKNVQVKITDIHIKYEDDVTDPERPLSFGVTLGEFSLLLVKLDSLSAYWNVGCCMSYHGSREHILDQLKREILTSRNIPPDHQYIFQPISASAKLYMNPCAESELKTPKLDGNVEVQNIAIELTKPQYLSMIDFLESLDYMVRNVPYRKYKPCLPLHTNCRQWWKYAIDSVLEVHIRRYTQMWSWSHIRKHRQLLKSYKIAYKNKLTQAKVSEETQKQIQVIHSGQKLRKKSAEAGEKRGWFSGFWGKKESKKKDEDSLIPETIDDLMTPEEKEKFFTAIGYSESSYNFALPKQYVAHILTLKLVSTSIIIRENRNVPEILRIQIIGLGTQVSQRPGAQALKIEAKLEHWYVTGLRQQDIVPSLVASIGDTSSSLLRIEFETNPESSPADQTLLVQSQPVEVIYDAKTINAIVEFFRSDKGLDLEQITSATLMKLEEIKERTATGLTHMIETRKVLDLRINLKPSYLIIPQTGFHHEKSNLLILDFGTFQLNSKDQGTQKTTNSSLEEIIDKAYDKFDVEIKSVQLLFAKAEENWKKCRFQHPSTMHILQPMDIHVELAKAMVEKDVRMARFKVSGGLPLMHVRISDQKIKDTLRLIDSIPLPQKSSTPSPERQVATIPVLSGGTKGLLGTSLLLDGLESGENQKILFLCEAKPARGSVVWEFVEKSDDEYFDAEDGDLQTARTVKASELKKASEVPNEELVNLLLKFEIKEVILELTKQQKEEETILVFNVTQLGTEATMRTFDLTAVSYLRKISLDYHEIKGSRKKPLHLISSSDKPGLDLLKVEYVKVDKNGPSFQTTFEKTEQTIKVTFSSLNLLLQTQALLSALNYLTTIIPSDGENTGVVKEAQAATEKQKNSPLQKAMVSSRDSDIINFRLFAKLNAFCVTICDEKSNIAEIKIQGLDSSLSLQSKKQSLFARLENIIVTDVDPKTVHKKAVSIVGNEVFRFNLDLYPDATEGDSYTDMSTVDGVVALHVGCIQIVYLHKFLLSLLSFLSNFQVAKEALSAATAQAAEKAATSVKDLAQRSFRVSVNIDLKAPVIVIPQSSVSTSAVVVDLGLIRVHNQFCLVSGEDTASPPVIDKMEVQLTKLKLSRTAIQSGDSHPDIQLLHPINLEFFVNRNLAANWYHKVPVLEIKGCLDSMNVSLNQEDLNLLFRILAENLGEASEDLDKGKPRIQDIGETKACREVSAPQDVPTTQGASPARVGETRSLDIINVLLNFEIKEVMVTLMKKAEKKGTPLHELKILHLGVQAKVKAHDMIAEAYLRRISVRCFDFPGPSTSEGDVFDLKVTAELNAFNIFVCDQKSSIADIKIHGMDASISVKPKQTDVFARLENIIVMNVDSLSIHKKAVSILGDEVFRFQMTLYPDATEGEAYGDMSKVDGKLSLKVGCIQIVYVHKFFMSLLSFLNNFQTAKEALSTATVQAAERAASSVKDLAQKSFRLLMDINLKAPVITIPQSSVSPNAVIADLGLIRVENKFSLVPVEHYSLPPVAENMSIQLTQLKLSRTVLQFDSLQPDIEILEPVNMLLSIQRNLSAAWYTQIPGMEIKGKLKPMQVALSQDDLTVLMKILLENLGEASSQPSPTQSAQEAARVKRDTRSGPDYLKGKMFKDGSMDVSLKLKTCTLDDLREGIERATSRMIDKKNDQDSNSSMVDVSYRQDKNGSQINAVLDKLYVCASVEFLMTVADFFIKAMPQSPEDIAKEIQIPPRQTAVGRVKSEKDDSVRPNMTLKAMITDPEVVFVANLTRADAPALTASFQCNLSLSTSKLEQMMEASVRDLKVLACPFLRERRGKNITTVLQPCSLFMEKCTWASGKQNINVMVKEFVIKISPIILNTVMTILAAMSPKAKEDDLKDTAKEMENLWAIKSVTDYNSWFLGVDTATEVTENFRDFEHPLIEENCVVAVESVQITLECGLGHRTMPLLLAESKFSGNIKNWTSLMAAAADMTLEVKKNPIQDKSLMPGDDFIPESQMAVHISSGATMNITISKSCLNVFNNLAKGFSEGAASTFDYSLKDRAPFTVRNALGVPIKVQPNRNLKVMGSPDKSDIYDVDTGQHLELEYDSLEPSRQGKLSILSRQESSFFTLTFVPHGYTEVGSVPVARPGRRLYNVRNPSASRSDSVLVQIDATEGNKVITLRSPLQIKNHFSIAFIIYKFVKNVKLLERIGIARPEEEFHVPLDSYRCQLYVQPAGRLERQYTQSTTYISWKEELHRSSEVRCMLQCPAVEVNFLPLIVNTVALPDELSYIGAHGEDWDPAYVIHLYPPLTLRNLLPYSLRYLLEGTAEAQELAEGSAADVLHSRISGEIMELVLVKYLGKNWSGHFRICDTLPEFFLVCFSSDTGEAMTVDLSVHVRRLGCRVELSVFSPYWLINKTSRVLQYCSEDIHVKHPADFRDIVLFSFKKKNIFSKNKVQLKISTSDWSSGFSLDTVGSYGCVKCPATNMDYLVGVSIKMSSFNLSRIVTLTPFCTIANKSSLELEVGEIASDGSIPTNKWHYVASSECIPFWPENLSGKLCVRVVGYEGSSKPFFYNRQDNGTLLSLEELDECGQFPYDANIQIHWVSFLDGRQRVLLFTDDVALVSKALQAEEMEQADHEVTLSLHSLGLSLVNNEIKQEVSYVGITSSGVVWEMKPKQKWKPFSQKQIMSLEQSYQKHLVSQDRGWIKLDSNFEVNFDKVPMEMRLPIRCPIKRDFLSGIQVEFKQSPHQRSLRARLYWLQVDNQLPGTMFPVVFHPVAPPKSIALDSEPKPFIDVSVITRFNEYSQVLQFKYFMVLIQEMALKVDQGFLGAVIALFTPTTAPETERKRTKLIQQDIDALNTELMESSMTDMSILSFFEHFHISPVKLHLSLSLGSGGEESDKEKQEMIAIHSVNLLLKSIGATLTDVDDLIFKLAYYEIRYQFYKRDQLMWSVVRHYTEQFLKQMYVLVLGLDVLGNPFGLIRGLSEGVEAFFYEPFQGAVQGPEEFAEGLVIGVRSLFGHTVGGAAGVVSRITGSVGKGLAAITMDKEYQQKRREEMGRQPKDFGDSLARGGKGFLRGVVGGVTGIITKPVEGAKKEGAAGFFKGIGKGLVGAVARPTGGIIDMASSTFQGIQRAAESTEEVSSLRPPRLIHEDGIIRPYDRQESEGSDLLENHIKKLEGETYQFHCAVPGHKRAVLMITNRRVLFIKEVEILGHMSVDWQCLFEDFVCPPGVSENLLKISVKVREYESALQSQGRSWSCWLPLSYRGRLSGGAVPSLSVLVHAKL